MKKEFYLIEIQGDKYIMLNPYKKLTIGTCNSAIFKGIEQPKDKNQCIFTFFNIGYTIIKRIDLRTKEAKEIKKQYGFFSADKLRNYKNLFV